jgi:hypothetical protein
MSESKINILKELEEGDNEDSEDSVLVVNDYEVIKESYRVYKVVNIKTGRTYRVWSAGDREIYTCNCPVFTFKSVPCKHINLVLKLEGKIK